jgi:serine/threonine protein kinase
MVKRGYYTERNAASITATIFNAMSYVHAHDIVHRDLKTANLMFTNNDPLSELIIVDFGLARSTVEATDDSPEAKQVLMTTWRVGTPFYQSPEVA